jgi:uncharacterized protein YjeT (DUF2065 family)
MPNAVDMVMMQSMMMGRILAPILVITGLALLFNANMIRGMLDEVVKGKQYLALFMTGFFTLVLGVLMVGAHNVWVWNWTLIITILSWATLLKGVTLMLVPGLSASVTQSVKNSNGLMVLAGLVSVILGLVLVYFSYYAIPGTAVMV